MLQGALIAESIRPGTSLDDLNLIVRQITRHAPDGTTDEQPPIWTDIYFEVDHLLRGRRAGRGRSGPEAR